MSWTSCKLRPCSCDFILGNLITRDQIRRERKAKDHIHVFTVQKMRLLLIVSPDERPALPAICKMVLCHFSRMILDVFSAYLSLQPMEGCPDRSHIFACLNRACHSSSPMEWSAWAVLTISCVTVSPILKLTWSKYSSSKPWEYRMSFNSYNDEHPLGKTRRVVAAELIGLTQRVAILRYPLAQGCGTWFLAYVANRVTLAEESVVRPVGRAGEILDCCRQREIYSLNALQIKVTLIAVDTGHCCPRIPDSSLKFYIHMLLFWNLQI